MVERSDDLMTEEEYFLLAHMDDAIMTAQELPNCPRFGDWWRRSVGYIDSRMYQRSFFRTGQRQGAHARYAGVFQHRWTKLNPPCWVDTT